jgi:hypothetical protein
MTKSSPFAILEDPQEIARAEKATEIAWSYIEAGIPPAERDRQCMRMVHVVVPLAIERMDEPTDLAHRAIRRFQEIQLRR